MDPGWDGDVQLHKGGYWGVSFGSSGGVGGSAGVGSTEVWLVVVWWWWRQ